MNCFAQKSSPNSDEWALAAMLLAILNIAAPTGARSFSRVLRQVPTGAGRRLSITFLPDFWVVSVAPRETVQSCRAEFRALWLQEGQNAAELNAEQERRQELVAPMERAKHRVMLGIEHSSQSAPNTPLQTDSRAIVCARALLFDAAIAER